jgi:hypothetical protein
MSMPASPTQGSGGLTDVVTALQGITRQLTALVKAFTGRVTQGTFTFPAAATVTIAQAAVQANSNITLTPTNAAASALVGSSKSPYVPIGSIVPGTGFTVNTGDGTNATGTETFQYQITTTM